jgi:RNase adaptor protein for sRNA GlmZ degradation
MPGLATVTVTGTSGPGLTLTAGVFTDVGKFTLNPVTAMLEMVKSDGEVINVSIAAATTILVVLSAAFGNYTVTIS